MSGPINMTNNKAGALLDLQTAINGNLYDWTKSMSIDSTEFGYTENSVATGTMTTILSPGKCYIGFDLTKLNSSKTLLNGTSSQQSPINLILNINSAVTAAKTVYLVLNYDCVFIIDPRTKTITLNQ